MASVKIVQGDDGRMYKVPDHVPTSEAAQVGIPLATNIIPDEYPEPIASLLRDDLAQRGIETPYDILKTHPKILRQAIQNVLRLSVKRIQDHADQQIKD